MLSVLALFLMPIGGGIPAGVLLARSHGLPWPIAAGLYLISDVILALAFEPFLRLVIRLGHGIPWVERFVMAFKASTELLIAPYRRKGLGPVSLVIISFGVDPMTGRAATLAAGHGFLAGWSFAIAGDMLYYAVIALATLRLNAYIKNPNLTVFIALCAMLLVPALVRRIRSTGTDSKAFDYGRH